MPVSVAVAICVGADDRFPSDVAPETKFILTEAGETLLTEAGEKIKQED